MAMTSSIQPHWTHPAASRSPPISAKPAISPTPAKAKVYSNNVRAKSNETFQQVRRKLEESRKSFLNEQNLVDTIDEVPHINLIKEIYEQNDRNTKLSGKLAEEQPKEQAKCKLPTRLAPPNSECCEVNSVGKRSTKKISFKIRRNASILRRKEPKPLNLVQELAKKYNELDEQTHTTANSGDLHPKVHKLIKRANSQNLKRRPSAKDTQKQLSHELHDRVNTNVRAAIAIFEQKCTTRIEALKQQQQQQQQQQQVANKPKIPEKTFDVQAIAVRNQEKRIRLRQKMNAPCDSATGAQMPRCNRAIVNNLCNNPNMQNNGSAVCKIDDDGSSSAMAAAAASVSAVAENPPMATTDISEEVPVVSLTMHTAMKKCESNYECQKFGRYARTIFSTTNRNTIASKIPVEDLPIIIYAAEVKPEDTNQEYEKIEDTAQNEEIKDTKDNPTTENEKEVPNNKCIDDDDYDIVVPPENNESLVVVVSETATTEEVPPLPPRISKLGKIYSTLSAEKSSKSNSATTDDDYEIPEVPDEENIYESLSRCSRLCSPVETKNTARKLSGGLSRNQTEPLPPRPLSSGSSSIQSNDYQEYNDESNYYESIYSKRDDNYESIYGGSRLDAASRACYNKKRLSIQSDQQSNSIYGRSITSWAEEVLDTYIGNVSSSTSASASDKAGSDLSGSSDDWVDISDHEHDADGRNKCSKFVIVREARHQKVTKKNSGWSQQIRGQWNKVPKKMHHSNDSDSDHTYETLYNNAGMPIEHQAQLLHHRPELQRQLDAAVADDDDDDDDDFDSFDSDCESDNSFAKNDSGVDMGNTQLPDPPASNQYAFTRFAASAGKNVMKRLRRNWSMRKNDISKSLSRITKSRKSRTDLDTIETETNAPTVDKDDKSNKSLARRGFLNKFKRSMSMSGDIGDHFADRPKSTFYLTEAFDVDDDEPPLPAVITTPTIIDADAKENGGNRVTPPLRAPKPNLVRPQMPPPPTPTQPLKTTRSQSWYTECGLFKPDQQAPTLPRRPNSFWYAEVGLYQSGSPPSTSGSSENSGNKDDTSDDYYTKNYYNDSVKSYDSNDTKKDEAFNSLQGDIQLRLQDEPLYQFYDAAVLESVCQSGLSDYYDDYEEIAKDKRISLSLNANRPTAMELVSSPQRNNVSVARTLWCEIPEVVQSTVLSTLSVHQKKVQEAKFEMLTSEASYLNSLNVLTDHFVRQLKDSDLLNEEEKRILCAKIMPVKRCSGKLLIDLEKCWQENILLHGVCDIVKRHAEESFSVYVDYCENQIILDQTLKRLKERPAFVEFVRQLEAHSVCQLLTLYSFLMLPMQRITRWPLLIDAILKRLSPQDDEYQSCQYALATLNKIVTQCNEGARNMERVTEMKKLAAQMEFAKGVPPFALVDGHRWLVRSGQLTQMHNRGDDVKLTFGKRFTKIPVHLFLFNDIFVVAKNKGEGIFAVQHYCSRSYLELNGESLATLPTKDTQGRHLIFLTILENHDEKTVEMLLSCSSESDRERWLEALTPPKSENPDETLYECWDCPQVTAVHNYTANQPDELPLTRGDVINVTRKMADGWYHGERIRDGEMGWFPANYTMEVANPHVRARNLKQRYRLLAYSENYLKSK